ncbi:hypothetical protein FCH28_29820 [Streptomyces piniterrae]|uniref:Peptide chain release factor 1 n=1 Tax=Streptomyces piniterrae TaxID=2571125 RepID=A0A4V5MI95_9ACTN|nr:Vms1/Ankzf1 family peptidyl-tRNA hydrolase [Streptomyces piniterrae]TJZ44538.1 hypothetical protein FCH28_29820 [Streptomyces piniterrae]
MISSTKIDTDVLREFHRTPGPVDSVYFNLETLPQQEENATLRWHKLTDRLARQGADAASLTALTDRVLPALPGSGALAAFAVRGDVPLVVEMPDFHHEDMAVHGPLPHLLPLLEWQQEHPAHVLAIVDRIGADLEVYPTGATKATARRTVTGPDDEIRGNGAQLRFQHRAEDSWDHNAAEVADAIGETLSQHSARLLLLAGDVRARQFLMKHLPEWVRREVTIRSVSGSRSHDGAVQERMAQVEAETRRAGQEETAALLRLLAEERSPGGRAVEGVHATLDALARGRLRTLAVTDDPQDRRTAWSGPAPTDVSDRRGVLQPNGGAVVRGRLADVAVRAALLTGAEVRALPTDTPHAPKQGIGGVCRFA